MFLLKIAVTSSIIDYVYRNYKVGWVAGRVDKDSAPNNIRYGDREGTYEDDTFEALLRQNVI